MRHLVASLLHVTFDDSLAVPNPVGGGEEETKKKKKQRKKASTVDVKDCVLRLINLRIPVESERIGLDAAGARCVYHLLRFTPRLCEDILNAILDSYSADELLRVAKDGLGSRCVMDGILAGATKTPMFISAVKGLFTKLEGKWVSLATDRVGHHTVKRMFHALPKIDDKSKLADELSAGGNRLSGNAMGRSILELCTLDLYNDNCKDWRQKLSKSMSKECAFVPHAPVKAPSADSHSNAGPTKAKRKRKRKRGGDKEELP